jgi:hypothetical protein
VIEARDDILGTFRTAWLASETSQDLPVIYPDVSDEPPTSGAYARLTLVHTGGTQATLANAEGKRRWRATGTLTIQLFTPPGGGQVLSDQLLVITKNAFQGVTTADGVTFRDVTIREIGAVSGWYQANVLVAFEYDEVR